MRTLLWKIAVWGYRPRWCLGSRFQRWWYHRIGKLQNYLSYKLEEDIRAASRAGTEMTQQTRIDKGLYWDRAWSLVSGCSPVSLGCLNCWSEGKWTGEIRLMEQDLNKPLKVKKPTTWAVWNDLFHESVPFRFVDKAIAVMALCPQHTFLILTKRPARMLEYFCNYPSVCSDGNVEHELTTNPDLLWEASRLFGGTPERYCDIVGVDETQASSDYMVELDHLPTFPLPNIWLGISAEYHAHYLPRTHYLKQTPARVRFVSIESCLGPFYYIDLDDIDWCIVGAETGPHKRPMELDWARLLRDQCIASGTPFFFKRDSDGNHELDGQLWEEFPV